VIRHRWELADLELAPGAQLTFHAAASDYLPQTGRSQPRRLEVITDEQLSERIAASQSLVLAELDRVLRMQRQSRDQVAALEVQVSELGYLKQHQIDHLRGAELNQRQVNSSLSSRSEGVPMHILGLLADLENNRLDSPDVKRRMRALLAELDRLGREHLPIISRELTGAIKTAQVALKSQPPDGKKPDDKPSTPPAAVADRLVAAAGHQDRVIASLERMLGQLARWDNYRRFHRRIGQLLRDQKEAAGRATELGRRTLSRELKDLNPQEAADLKTLARWQLELARRLEATLEQMGQTSLQLRDSDPLAAETVSDALGRARQLAISDQMRSAGGYLQQNQIGQAIGRQRRSIQDLQEILDILANRREHELARLVKKLRQAESDLTQLEGEQRQLQKQMQKAAGDPDQAAGGRQLKRLAQQQNRLEQLTRSLARRLERLLADRAAGSTGQAADKMAQAGQSARSGGGQSASQQAQGARKDLEEARRQLTKNRRKAKAELATEQLSRLQDTLQHLYRRQEKVVGRTSQIDQRRQSEGGLTLPQTAGLRKLAAEQRTLRTETSLIGQKLAGRSAFGLSLSEVAGEMDRAAGLLSRLRTGRQTQEAEQNALGRLGQILQAIKPEEPKGPRSKSDGSGGGQPQQAEQGRMPGAGAMTLAELKLVNLLQEEINLRTRELEESFGKTDELSDDARRRYRQLSREQGRLAEILLGLLPSQQQESSDELLGPLNEEELR